MHGCSSHPYIVYSFKSLTILSSSCGVLYINHVHCLQLVETTVIATTEATVQMAPVIVSLVTWETTVNNVIILSFVFIGDSP